MRDQCQGEKWALSHAPENNFLKSQFVNRSICCKPSNTLNESATMSGSYLSETRANSRNFVDLAIWLGQISSAYPKRVSHCLNSKKHVTAKLFSHQLMVVYVAMELNRWRNSQNSLHTSGPSGTISIWVAAREKSADVYLPLYFPLLWPTSQKWFPYVLGQLFVVSWTTNVQAKPAGRYKQHLWRWPSPGCEKWVFVPNW